MNSFSNHIGLIIGIGLLIAMMIICHYANRHFVLNKIEINKSHSLPDSFQNITANRINYYATPDCKNQSLVCPGQHPMIPCSLIKKCPGKLGYDNLSEDDKHVVDMYVYLTGLLEASDVYNTQDTDIWYKF